MSKFKALANATLNAINEVVQDSKEFRKQEKACQKTKPVSTVSSVPQVNPVDIAAVQAQSRRECACLACHIAKAMVNFPTHINIHPYDSAVAVVISKLDNNKFSVKFDKKDPSEEFTTSNFHVELQTELNRRVEFVQSRAVQAIEAANTAFSLAEQNLYVKYNHPASPYYGYGFGYYDDLQSAQLDYDSAIADNRVFLNTIHFYSLVDMGNYVVVTFTAGYNGGSVLC